MLVEQRYLVEVDGNNPGLSTDHIIHAEPDLSRHISFLFACMATHDSAPNEYGASSILPIPISNDSNSINSTNFRGIALISVYCKLLDNIILETFHDKLCTSDRQFGFKPKRIYYYVYNGTQRNFVVFQF